MRFTSDFEIEKNDGQHIIIATATILHEGNNKYQIEDLEWSAEDWHGNDINHNYDDSDVCDYIYYQLERDKNESN